MRLTFKQVGELLSALHEIAPGKRPLLLFRIKNLQKLGFPPGINVGRGSRPNYDVEMLLQLVLIFELFQAGFRSERAASIVLSDWPRIGAPFGLLFAQPSDAHTRVASIELEALADLTSEWGNTRPLPAIEIIDGSWHAGRRSAVIDLVSLAFRFWDAVDASSLDSSSLKIALETWRSKLGA